MILDGSRIFIVEDNQGNASIMQMLLEQDGAIVIRGRWGGKETIDILVRNKPIDIILMDLMLPNGITGYDVFDDVRSCDDMHDVPIVAVSASDPAGAIPKVRQKGFQGFIPKPVSFTEFSKQIQYVLEGNQIWNIGRFM